METLETLTEEYGIWLKANKLPEMSAEEVLYEGVNQEQREWLHDFIERWDEAARREI